MKEATSGPVLLVDPSLFTAPYDAALLHGLQAAGLDPLLVTRPARPAEQLDVEPRQIATLFYKHVDRLTRLPAPLRALTKGLAHAWGWLRLLRLVRRLRPRVVHLQWVVVPFIDIAGLWLLRRYQPVVLTAHDTIAYNGEKLPLLQRLGFDVPIRLADHVIVHTESGRQALLKRGIAVQKLSVVPHGPLQPPVLTGPPPAHCPRWTFVAFGEIKPYKGLDVLLDAFARLPAELRAQGRVIIAGRPRMDMGELLSRSAVLGAELVELRTFRLSDAQMAELFAEADCFVFPYRQIDASGVYFLTKSLGKWIIASRVGIFAEDLQEGTQGMLVPAGRIDALSAALAAAIRGRPNGLALSTHDSWTDIGRQTAALYQSLAS